MFPYVFLGMVLCFFAGVFIPTIVKRLKDGPDKPPVPITGGGGDIGGHGKGDGKGGDKPAV